MKVLIVEGQRQATDDVFTALKRTEDAVVRGGNRENATRLIHTHDAQIVVLIAVPFQSWHVQLLRDLRGWERPPRSLVITAPEPSDQITLLESGADACLPYPLAPGLAAAQVQALSRRARAEAVEAAVPDIVRVRELSVDFSRYEVSFAGEVLAVTPAEFRILACLARRAGKVVPTAMLFIEALGYEVSGQQAKDILKVHVRRIRNKIRDAGGDPDYIWNIRGFGYLLERRARGRQTYEGDAEEPEEAASSV